MRLSIGIQKNIVTKFGLSHWEKERLVDLICLKVFKEFTHNYQLQQVEAIRIDKYITKESILDLPLAMERYVKDYPR